MQNPRQIVARHAGAVIPFEGDECGHAAGERGVVRLCGGPFGQHRAGAGQIGTHFVVGGLEVRDSFAAGDGAPDRDDRAHDARAILCRRCAELCRGDQIRIAGEAIGQQLFRRVGEAGPVGGVGRAIGDHAATSVSSCPAAVPQSSGRLARTSASATAGQTLLPIIRICALLLSGLPLGPMGSST